MPEVGDIQWPVVVTQRDGGTIVAFRSVREMQGALERVDIEAGEYPLALDAAGRELRLIPVGNYGVEVAVESEGDLDQLRRALLRDLHLCASTRGLDDSPEWQTMSVDALLDLVVSRRSRQPGFLTRILGRIFNRESDPS